MADREARIRITAKDDTASGIQRAKASLAALSSEAAAVGASFRAVGGALAAGFAGVSLVSAFRGVVDGVDRLNDLKDATGASIENLSALEDVAARTGTSFETVSGALTKFNQGLNNSKPGSDIAAVFDALGLSAEKLKREDPAEALRQVAVAFNGFADDGNKARAAQELFGRSIGEVAPLLKDLAAEGRLNATVTTAQAEAAEKFNNQLNVLNKNALDLGRTVAGPVVDAFNALFDRINNNKLQGGGFFDFIASEYKRVTREGLELIGVVDKTRAAFNLNSAAGGGRGFVNPAVVKPTLAVASAVKTLGRAVRESREGGSSFRDYATEISESVARLVQDSDLVKLAKLTDQLAELDKLQAAGLDPRLIADARRRLLPKPEDFGPPIPQELLDRQEELNRILDQTPTAQLEKARQVQEDLAVAYERGRFGAVGSAEAVRLYGEAAQTALGTLPDLIEKADTAAADLGMSFASAFENAIVGGQKFSDVLKGLEQDILRIITRKLVTEPLAAGVTNFIQPATAAGGFDFSSIFGKIAGAFSGFFADGGVIPPGRWGMVGERGPEPAFGGRTGLSVQPAGMGPMTIIQNFAAPIDRRTQAQVAAEAQRGLASGRRNL